MRIPRDPVGEVIVVRRDPRLAFRIVETKMNYGYLGDRLNHSAAENFPILVGDLRRLARPPIVTPTTTTSSTAATPKISSSTARKALLDYATLRLLWGWYRRDRDARGGTGEHPTRPDRVVSRSAGREAPSAAWQMWTSGTRPVRRS